MLSYEKILILAEEEKSLGVCRRESKIVMKKTITICMRNPAQFGSAKKKTKIAPRFELDDKMLSLDVIVVEFNWNIININTIHTPNKLSSIANTKCKILTSNLTIF